MFARSLRKLCGPLPPNTFVSSSPMPVFFEETLLSCRPYREYRDMFALTEADLHAGRVLDCAGGGASFCAEARAMGADVVAVDPRYDMTPEAMREMALEGVQRGNQFVTENIRRYSWRYFADPADHHRTREGACGLFLAHYSDPASRACYLPASLPNLPFRDGEFRLVLCGHLLFTYADRFDYDFHLAAAREMLRVTSHQVRIFPLLDYESHVCEFVKEIRDALLADGFHSTVTAVPYEFQQGGNEMLVLSHTPIR